MSLWFSWQAKDGRRRLWLIDTDPLALILALGLLVQLALTLPSLIWSIGMWAFGALMLMAVGWSCLLAAKVSLFRRGIWFSWGPHRMSWPYHRLYRAAYAIIAMGAGLLVLTWMWTA